MLSQRDAWGLARVADPRIHVDGIGNGKRLRIDLGGEAYKGKVTASKQGCNTNKKWSGWSSFCAISLVSP